MSEKNYSVKSKQTIFNAETHLDSGLLTLTMFSLHSHQSYQSHHQAFAVSHNHGYGYRQVDI